MKTLLLLASLLVHTSTGLAQSDGPAVHKIDRKLHEKTKFRNAEYPGFSPKDATGAKLPR